MLIFEKPEKLAHQGPQAYMANIGWSQEWPVNEMKHVFASLLIAL